jgi:hypothetical protein
MTRDGRGRRATSEPERTTPSTPEPAKRAIAVACTAKPALAWRYPSRAPAAHDQQSADARQGNRGQRRHGRGNQDRLQGAFEKTLPSHRMTLRGTGGAYPEIDTARIKPVPAPAPSGARLASTPGNSRPSKPWVEERRTNSDVRLGLRRFRPPTAKSC